MKEEKQNIMKIINTNCWKCNKLMKVSFVISDGCYYGPKEFTDSQVEIAKSKGAILKKQFSKTVKERYVANTCGHCGSFVGDFFIHEYLEETKYEEIVL